MLVCFLILRYFDVQVVNEAPDKTMPRDVQKVRMLGLLIGLETPLLCLYLRCAGGKGLFERSLLRRKCYVGVFRCSEAPTGLAFHSCTVTNIFARGRHLLQLRC